LGRDEDGGTSRIERLESVVLVVVGALIGARAHAMHTEDQSVGLVRVVVTRNGDDVLSTEAGTRHLDGVGAGLEGRERRATAGTCNGGISKRIAVGAAGAAARGSSGAAARGPAGASSGGATRSDPTARGGPAARGATTSSTGGRAGESWPDGRPAPQGTSLLVCNRAALAPARPQDSRQARTAHEMLE
jgi:hypothetical protein